MGTLPNIHIERCMEMESTTEMEHDGFIELNEMLSFEMDAFGNEDDDSVDDPLSFGIPDHFKNIQNPQ